MNGAGFVELDVVELVEEGPPAATGRTTRYICVRSESDALSTNVEDVVFCSAVPLVGAASNSDARRSPVVEFATGLYKTVSSEDRSQRRTKYPP